MSLILNVLWLIFGGLVMASVWLVIGLVLAITVIGMPWALSALNMARLALLPFGSRIVNREDYAGHGDIGTGSMGAIGNVIWFVFAGIWIALGHLFFGFICAVTIIGIPFALQHLKLASLAIAPIGKIVINDDARWPSDRGAYR